MSTKIYDAVILPYDSISEIVPEMHKIQRMELDNLEAELANGLCGLMQQGKANAIREFFSSKARRDVEGVSYSRKRHAFREAAAAFIAAENNNPLIVIDTTALRLFAEACRDNIPSVSCLEISILTTMIQELGKCRTLSFLEGPSHTTLLKWYHLSRKTQKYLRETFPDFEYQDQADGPELSELEPELDKSLDEFAKSLTKGTVEELHKSFAEFLQKYDKALTAYYDRDPSDVFTMAVEDAGESAEDEFEPNEIVEANDMALLVKRSLAYEIYRQRDAIWDKALRNRYTYEEAALSFDVFCGPLNKPENILCRVIPKACNMVDGMLDGKPRTENEDTEAFLFPDMYEEEIREFLNSVTENTSNH